MTAKVLEFPEHRVSQTVSIRHPSWTSLVLYMEDYTRDTCDDYYVDADFDTMMDDDTFNIRDFEDASCSA